MKTHFSLFYLLAFVGVTILMRGAESKNPPPALIREDLDLIKCDVCEELATALANGVHNFANRKAPLKMEEFEVIEIMENVCKPTNETGYWIRKIDIAESIQKDPKTNTDKRFLSFTYPQGISKCNSECVTIAKSCTDLLDNEIDPDDLSVFLYKKRPTADDLKSKLCKSWTNRCKVPKKSLPENYKRREIHYMVLSEKDLEMEQLVARMNTMGLKGSLKDREEMDKMMEEYSSLPDPYEGDDGYGDNAFEL
jgi:hypothetical protein